MIRDLQLEDCVTLEGRKSHEEISAYLSVAEAIVQSSLQEGFPNSIAEAMMAGVPVIATDCKGITEVIVPEKNGWIAKRGDPSSIASCIESCLKNRKQNAIFSRLSKQKAIEVFSDAVHNYEFNSFFYKAHLKIF